ncbi:MAG: DUF5131 family protein [Coriobacteriia bacterium]
MADTKIAWTDCVWNPVTGCTRISAGCANCYAERMGLRLKAMGQPKYANSFDVVTCHPETLALPMKWRKPRMVFVNSMGDLFHDDAPEAFIRDAFDVMAEASQHTFQLLTKREKRLVELADKLPWPPNVWMGASVESGDYVHRIDALRSVPAAVRFVSFEPLIGPVPGAVDLSEIGWAIVGGETGPKCRPMDPAWAREIRDACQSQDVAFFFKQWGGSDRRKDLDGREWHEMPTPGMPLAGDRGGSRDE